MTVKSAVRHITDLTLARGGQALGLGDLSREYLASMREVMTPGDVARYLMKRTFPLWQAVGLHVLPSHFYEPVPDTRTLREALWQRHSELPGIDMNEQGQFDLLDRFVGQFRYEYEGLPRDKTHVPYQYYSRNHRFSSVDGEILYCMIRHFKPRIIFEVGSGYSTYLAAQASLRNKQVEGAACELVACEPYPNAVIRAGFPGLTRLLPKAIQDVPYSELERLDENDILFIDSSHVLKIGSDVQYEYLEVLPRLRKGVIVHIHDIFLPAEYPRTWVKHYFRFWNEQYLLQAFLAFNQSFEVLWAGSYMHLKSPDRLTRAFSSYDRRLHWPGSFWIRKTR